MTGISKTGEFGQQAWVEVFLTLYWCAVRVVWIEERYEALAPTVAVWEQRAAQPFCVAYMLSIALVGTRAYRGG